MHYACNIARGYESVYMPLCVWCVCMQDGLSLSFGLIEALNVETLCNLL